MAFENINTELLKNALNNCINSINYSSSKQILDDIQGNNIWVCASRDNFKKALEKLINVRYKELENKLKQYCTLVDQIEKYKQVLDNNATLQAQLQALDVEDSESATLNEISSINSKINSNDIMLANIKGNIESLL